MDISITSGTGSGSTQLSSFDKALNNAGISNFNLIYLSSIIPKNTKVRVKKPNVQNGDYFGNRLYCVMARNTEINPEKSAWAGIGWVQSKDGKGLFVEHVGSSREEVDNLIHRTLEDMKKYRKDKFGEIKKIIRGIKCKEIPVTVVVAAVYKSENWK